MIKKLALLMVVSFTNLVFAAIPYDHINFAATNFEEAVDWYLKHFGGIPGSFNRGSVVDLRADYLERY